MTADVRVLAPEDLPTAWAVLVRAFGSAVHPDDVAVELSLVDPARFHAVHLDDRMVAKAGSFAMSTAVPGAVLPVAGVTAHVACGGVCARVAARTPGLAERDARWWAYRLHGPGAWARERLSAAGGRHRRRLRVVLDGPGRARRPAGRGHPGTRAGRRGRRCRLPALATCSTST